VEFEDQAAVEWEEQAEGAAVDFEEDSESVFDEEASESMLEDVRFVTLFEVLLHLSYAVVRV
jgi:hypothetical protein